MSEWAVNNLDYLHLSEKSLIDDPFESFHEDMSNGDLLIKHAAELLTLSPMVKEESGIGIIRNGTAVVKACS